MKKLLIGTMAIVGAFAIAGCEDEKTAADLAEAKNKAAQDDVKVRATTSVPVPNITNFQARKNLAEFMKRQDEAGKIWYVYERAPLSGEILGFYQSSSYPQSVCTFMTPPENVRFYNDTGVNGDANWVATSAIALDGVYYKGGSCPDFFFDYNTGAMVVLDADAVTIAVDQPLDIDAPDYSFVVKENEE